MQQSPTPVLPKSTHSKNSRQPRGEDRKNKKRRNNVSYNSRPDTERRTDKTRQQKKKQPIYEAKKRNDLPKHQRK